MKNKIGCFFWDHPVYIMKCEWLKNELKYFVTFYFII